MTPVRRATWRRPRYYWGQLLDETDFQAEQDYHRVARLLHNLRFHQWGVVYGLTVTRHSDTEVLVAPGLAVDSLGREAMLEDSAILEIGDYGPNQTVYLTLGFEEKPEEQRKSEHGEGPSRLAEYSILAAATSAGAGASVTLASVRLDAGAKVVDRSISYTETKYASSVLSPSAVGERELAAGSVTQAKLGPGLRTGWVRMPFKPFPLENKKPFRIGPTEARSTDEGASGSLGIPAPPGVTEVTRFRVAGELNEGVISVRLYRCGWDPNESDHEKTTLLEKDFAGATPARSFEYVVDLDRALARMDAQYHALALVIDATKKASISLVAVEFGHP